jgi:hypothetical protein
MFLYPLLAQLGARVYELFSGDFRLDKSVPYYGQLIQPICKKYGDVLRHVLVNFLDPNDSAIRSYILRRLNASFIRQASGLNIDVLEKLGEARGHERLQIFLDTNFVFSFLKLHDNPANEVADDLLTLIDTIRGSVTVELYVLPITVDEIRRVIRDVCGKLENVVPQPNLAEATRRITPTGPVSRYLEAAASANHRLSPSDFFDPYDKGLIGILKERGIKLYNTNLDELRMDQAVLDDLIAQEKVQEKVRLQGAKPYASNLHDMVLWHFVARNRAAGAHAPLESGMWVCTVDYGLIAFDRHKRKKRGTPPVCLAPSSLIQLLQFWAPRTEQWDRAFVGAVREPLLFLDFDRPSEETTLSILKTISRFEDVGDLSPSTIYNVLTDKALRVRLEQDPRPGPEATVELVQSAIVGEAHRLEEELGRLSEERAADSEASRVRVDIAVKEAEGLKGLLEERHQDVQGLSEQLQIAREQLRDQEEKAKTDRAVQEDKQRALEDRLTSLEEADRDRRQRLRDTILVGVAATIVGGACAAASYFGGSALANQVKSPWVAWLGVAVAGLVVWLLAIDLLLTRAPSFSGKTVHQRLRWARRGLVSALVGVGIALLAAAIWSAST